MAPWKAAIDALRGIAICCAAAGPIFLFAGLAHKAIIARSWGPVVSYIFGLNPSKVLTGCVTVSLGSLPTLALIALVLHILSRRENDTFLLASMAGTAAGFAGLMATVSVYMGYPPDVDFRPLDMALTLLMSILLTMLFWLVAVRPQRRRRTLLRRHYAAIQAME